MQGNMERKFSKATLEKRLERLEESLRKEQERKHSVLNRQGWGHAMTHVKTGVSFRREDELKEKIRDIKEQLAEYGRNI